MDFRAALAKVLRDLQVGVNPLDTRNGINQAVQQVRPKDNQLEVLRRNVLDQTAYTPEARAYLQQVPLQQDQNEGEYGSFMSPTPMNQMTGGKGVVYIKPSLLTPEHAQMAIDTLRHEFNHALDPEAGGAKGIGSEGFNDAVHAVAGQSLQGKLQQFYTKEFAADPTKATQATKDMEGYADYGKGGQRVLLSNPALAAYYKKTYAPYTPARNYDPVYLDRRNK